jgi:hypothetical protein
MAAAREGKGPTERKRSKRKPLLLRLNPAVHDALAAWSAAELRSTTAQIEFLLRRALANSNRLPNGPPSPPQAPSKK